MSHILALNISSSDPADISLNTKVDRKTHLQCTYFGFFFAADTIRSCLKCNAIYHLHTCSATQFRQSAHRSTNFMFLADALLPGAMPHLFPTYANICKFVAAEIFASTVETDENRSATNLLI